MGLVIFELLLIEKKQSLAIINMAEALKKAL